MYTINTNLSLKLHYRRRQSGTEGSRRVAVVHKEETKRKKYEGWKNSKEGREKNEREKNFKK